MPTSPTARTLQRCRKFGWIAAVVEKWIPQTGRRLDVWGFGDILAVDDKPGALLIQATSDNGGNVAARVHKICGECAVPAAIWLAAGNRIETWGWRKRGPAGKRKLWEVRRVEVTQGMLNERREEAQ